MAYIVRRNPVGNAVNDLDRVWESLVSERGTFPPVDIIENDDDYTLIADLPGFRETEVEARIENRMLIIQSAEAAEKQDTQKQDQNYLIRERRRREFRRSFVVPKDADLESVNASFSNGMLTLTIAKRPEAKPRTIEIRRA